MTQYTPQQAHDDITTLFDAYYDAKKAGDSIPPNKRIESADSIVEHYVEINGKRPPAGVLSRLGTYILLDVLSDPHPDKMSRDEYPIASYAQTGRYFKRNTSIKDVEYSQEDVRGTVSNTTTGVRDVLISPVNKEAQAVGWDVFLRQILNDREYVAIISIYKDGMTQAETAERMSVSERWVRNLLADSLYKLRKSLPILSD